MMGQAKVAAVASSADAWESDKRPGLSQSLGNMDESMQLPWPSEDSNCESESIDKDPEVSNDWQYGQYTRRLTTCAHLDTFIQALFRIKCGERQGWEIV